MIRVHIKIGTTGRNYWGVKKVESISNIKEEVEKAIKFRKREELLGQPIFYRQDSEREFKQIE